MGVRFGVMADSQAECEAGLALLLASLGVVVVQRPAQVAGARWIARVAPDTAAAPAGEGQGREG